MFDREREKRIIENYQADEKAMILIFVQWCRNHDQDPIQLYKKAYPNQLPPKILEDLLTETVAPEEVDEISDALVLNALQGFGNDALAEVIQQVIDQQKNKRSD